MAKKTTKKSKAPRGGNTAADAAMAARGYSPVAAVAEQIAMDPATIQRWIKAGKVASAKHGRRLFVQLASLAKHLGPEVAAAFKLPSGKSRAA